MQRLARWAITKQVIAGNARQLQFASGLLLGRAESKYQKWLARFGRWDWIERELHPNVAG
jgi:hypothetical protein